MEFKTVKKCTVALETALKGLDRNMVDFLYQKGFITDDVCDQVLNGVSLLSPADKAHELVKGIKNRVKQDKGRYFVLVGGLTQGGVLYQSIVNILAVEYQKQTVKSTSPQYQQDPGPQNRQQANPVSNSGEWMLDNIFLVHVLKGFQCLFCTCCIYCITLRLVFLAMSKCSIFGVKRIWQVYLLAFFVSAPKCRDVVLGSYVQGMSLVARAQYKIDTPKSM